MGEGIARLSRNEHVLVDRDNVLYVGRVLNKSFEIKVGSNTLKIRTKDIWSIVYKNAPMYLKDELRMVNGSVLQGKITTTPIRLRIAGQTLKFPRRSVLALNFAFGVRAR